MGVIKLPWLYRTYQLGAARPRRQPAAGARGRRARAAAGDRRQPYAVRRRR